MKVTTYAKFEKTTKMAKFLLNVAGLGEAKKYHHLMRLNKNNLLFMLIGLHKSVRSRTILDFLIELIVGKNLN